MNPASTRVSTIRFRISAIATVVVAVVLAVVAVVLVGLLRQELFSNLDSSLEQRADTYEASFAAVDNDDLSTLLNSNDEDRAAQLVDAAGVVIASTQNLSGASPLGDSADAAGQSRIRSEGIAELEDDAYRVLTRGIATDSGAAVLHIAQNIDDLNDTIRNVTLALAVIVPLVVAGIATLVWWLVGRTLRPVELIRAEVADISGTDLQRRVPVPGQADEIARLAATMNQMLDRIDLAGRRQRQFVADASHELRTPLTRIRTELEVDANAPGAVDRAATHAAVLEEAIGVQHLLDNLLFLARSDERHPDTRLVAVDLDDIVFREATLLRETSPPTIDTSAVSAADLQGDPSQLARLVQNLLSNAVRHATSSVSIALAREASTIRLSVSDDGAGVPASARERIFERFGRADDARTRDAGGTGLGLAIVRDIARRHGGDVSYDDSWADGARFVVELDGR